MDVLVVNAGSSSLKLSLLDAADGILAATEVEHWDTEDPPPALHSFLNALPRVDAVGHRVVHGGPKLTAAAVLDPAVRREIEAVTDLAPLHQPRALAGIDAVSALLPGVPEVACFDTAFHAGMPAAAATYALPAAWRETYGLRRYGFHGLSHAYASRRAAHLLGSTPERLRIVSCHLGAGASLAAVQHGQSVDTTMGFTPLEGLVMATRAGNTDPGLLVWLLQDGRVSLDELSTGLEQRSGLAGLAGRPTSGTCCPAPTPATRPRSWLSTCTCTGCANWSRAWPPPWTGWTCCCSPAALASTSRRSGPGPRPASSAQPSTSSVTRPRPATPTSPHQAPPCAPW